jgi:hypothetical protein
MLLPRRAAKLDRSGFVVSEIRMEPRSVGTYTTILTTLMAIPSVQAMLILLYVSELRF